MNGKILFVCRGNVGRSQIAKEIYEKYSGYHADSAGIEVSKIGEKLKDKESAKDVVLAMKDYGIDISDNSRTRLTPEMIDRYDKIVVLAEKKVIPNYLKKSDKAIFWDVEDSYGKDLNGQKKTIEIIEKMVLELVK